jgi:hypothetical protein
VGGIYRPSTTTEATPKSDAVLNGIWIRSKGVDVNVGQELWRPTVLPPAVLRASAEGDSRETSAVSKRLAAFDPSRPGSRACA